MQHAPEILTNRRRTNLLPPLASEQRRSSDCERCVTGVVVGTLVGLRDPGVPLVDFTANRSRFTRAVRSTVNIKAEHLGREVALTFENEDPDRPILIGLIHDPAVMPPDDLPIKAQLDGENTTLSAKTELVLRCGEASITLTKEGKILIRGKYVLSHSSGANRIRGGSVEIN